MFELVKPFNELPSVFGPDRVTIKDTSLLPKPRAAVPNSTPVFLTQKTCEGNVELHATFQHPSWENAPQVGLLLNAAQSRAYSFLLFVPERGRPQLPAAKRSFADARNENDGVCLQIRRNGKMLLLATRASIHAGLADWTKAEKNLDDFDQLVDPDRLPYSYYASASLLRGFLCKEGKDDKGAVAAWRKGYFREYTQIERHPPKGMHDLDDAARLAYSILLSALAGDTGKEDPGAIPKKLDDAFPLVVFLRKAGWDRIANLQRAWSTPRGRDYARRIAYLDLPMPDVMPVTVQLIAVEALHQQAFGDPFHEEDFCWKPTEEVHDLYFPRQGNDPALLNKLLVPLGLAWAGLPGPNPLPQLNPKLRGRVAYLFGKRYLRLAEEQRGALRRAKARDYFRKALAYAPDDATLKQLVEVELKQLPTK